MMRSALPRGPAFRRHRAAVVEDEERLPARPRLQAPRQRRQLARRRLAVAQLHHRHAAGHRLRDDLLDVAALDGRLADDEAEHGWPETADAAWQRHETPPSPTTP